MGLGSVLGGIAAGIGAVVLLPVAGPVLAVTAIGAAVAGTAGGITISYSEIVIISPVDAWLEILKMQIVFNVCEDDDEEMVGCGQVV